MTIAVTAFYKFVIIDDPAVLRARFLDAAAACAMKGTILVAHEGINGTISGAPDAMAAFLDVVRSDARFADLVVKAATTPAHPFRRLKVKVKREIVSFGWPEADPSAHAVTRVAPKDWNALVADPDVLVLDTRNSYEVAAGTFAGAVDPRTRRFGDFPGFVAENLDPARHRRIAMFCTGGIRCEKAAAYLLAKGFPAVYTLDGGILNYLASVPHADSTFQGRCFVFDERETVAGE